MFVRHGMFVIIALALVGWDAQAQEPVAAQTTSPAPCLNGDWTGNWTSCTNGHSGPLKASFCQVDACHYEVRFQGRFCKVIPFHYRALLTVTGVSDGQIFLSASKRLGPLLGTFTITARATSTQFIAGYSSKDDQGQFTLTRSCQ
ncbi:hypothetical protein [Planctomicrobium piriforme]|uniref:Uncharacterized protein n=1 Tax=Planctomicrobium piriforme TaxID=1576369 RepID=A0A1I3J5X1_9PLAN|nr:hypothetical protein [Planctomicrobium piriforme]SFI55506.1 hypothetical protein SAMN05421753_11066 [Planctomicrobium piriforme]